MPSVLSVSVRKPALRHMIIIFHVMTKHEFRLNPILRYLAKAAKRSLAIGAWVCTQMKERVSAQL